MDSLWGNVFRVRPVAGTEALLRRVPMFTDLDRRELAELEKILYRREYRTGEVIFRQGDPGVGMYVVESGSVAIVYEPTERLLAELRGGDFFGEIALLNETPRSARATATAPTVLHGLFQPELFDLLERSPRVGVKLLLPLAQNLGTRLVHADGELQRLHERLATLEAGTEPDDDAAMG
ncbi:MAG: cyclic nucleotide-binding domain-containing protein [Rhodothermales bacterium]